MMRLFVGAWPPADGRVTLAELAARERRAGGELRWVPRDQHHVTLRFLGAMDGPAAVVDALEATPLPVTSAIGGPRVERMGQQIAIVPIEGVDELARAVIAATADLGKPPSDRPFRGHLTVARSTRGEFGDLIGRPVSVTWPVTSIRVVRSHLVPTGASYETLHVINLRGGG